MYLCLFLETFVQIFQHLLPHHGLGALVLLLQQQGLHTLVVVFELDQEFLQQLGTGLSPKHLGPVMCCNITKLNQPNY